MKVSIITVCYNAQNTIEDTIKSVISQTYPGIEYIIIDGFSTDKTTDIINKYTQNISYFISEKDYGIYNAMNKAINKSTGDILYFLNANDYLFDENVIQDVVNHFEKTKAAIVFGDMSFIKENGEEKERRSFELVDKLFLTSENLCHQGVFYKRKVFSSCGLYDENYRLFADYDLNLKVILKNKLKAHYLNRTIAKFTLEGQSNSNKLKEIQDKEKQEILNKYFKPGHFLANKILNKAFRTIARCPKKRKLAGYLFGFNI